MHRSGTSGADTPLLRVSRPVSACSRCKFNVVRLVALVLTYEQVVLPKSRLGIALPYIRTVLTAKSATASYLPALPVKNLEERENVRVQMTSLRRERREGLSKNGVFNLR